MRFLLSTLLYTTGHWNKPVALQFLNYKYYLLTGIQVGLLELINIFLKDVQDSWSESGGRAICRQTNFAIFLWVYSVMWGLASFVIVEYDVTSIRQEGTRFLQRRLETH